VHTTLIWTNGGGRKSPCITGETNSGQERNLRGKGKQRARTLGEYGRGQFEEDHFTNRDLHHALGYGRVVKIRGKKAKIGIKRRSFTIEKRGHLGRGGLHKTPNAEE